MVVVPLRLWEVWFGFGGFEQVETSSYVDPFALLIYRGFTPSLVCRWGVVFVKDVFIHLHG